MYHEILRVSHGHRFYILLDILLTISIERMCCCLSELVDFIHHHIDYSSGKSYLTWLGNLLTLLVILVGR